MTKDLYYTSQYVSYRIIMGKSSVLRHIFGLFWLRDAHVTNNNNEPIKIGDEVTPVVLFKCISVGF